MFAGPWFVSASYHEVYSIDFSAGSLDFLFLSMRPILRNRVNAVAWPPTGVCRWRRRDNTARGLGVVTGGDARDCAGAVKG